MTMENHHFSIGNTSSNTGCSIAMLVLGEKFILDFFTFMKLIWEGKIDTRHKTNSSHLPRSRAPKGNNPLIHPNFFQGASCLVFTEGKSQTVPPFHLTPESLTSHFGTSPLPLKKENTKKKHPCLFVVVFFHQEKTSLQSPTKARFHLEKKNCPLNPQEKKS